MIGGDFNLRIRELGNISEERELKDRKNKDIVVGNGGKNFVNWIQEIGWYILNGATTGDWEDEFTYLEAKGSAVIDYVIMNKKMHEWTQITCFLR